MSRFLHPKFPSIFCYYLWSSQLSFHDYQIMSFYVYCTFVQKYEN